MKIKIVIEKNKKNDKIIWKWKRKWFEHPPIVFENYSIFKYCTEKILYSYTMPAPLLFIFLECHTYTFLESWLLCPNPKSQPSDQNS
jgi:hypothetical protein